MRRACALLLCLAWAACGDGTTCDDGPADVGDVCLPSTVAPDLPITIELRELCGRGCTDKPSCTAVFRDAQVILDVEQEVCSDSFTAACLSLGCLQRTIQCQLPSLTAGDWVLSVPGGPARLLRVQPGGVASCRFLVP
ncbi:MAG TPA: hypothetical protein VMK66_07695 [Myxococcales bacterium]|nr:hypothetical protein [Myxococcales bacterium]